VRGKVQELTRGHRGGRCWGREGRRWRIDSEQRRAAELRGMAMVFRWPECRRAVGKWPDSFYTMMWCWWCAWPGLGGSGSPGRRRGQAAAGARAHRHCGPVVLVQESEIGRAGEHQWVAGVLLEHWIGDGLRQRRLSTTSSSCSGGPARWRAREKEKLYKCGCRNARGRALVAQGHTSS
jgi:hypothetical protein